jgi:hypothetical protein
MRYLGIKGKHTEKVNFINYFHVIEMAKKLGSKVAINCDDYNGEKLSKFIKWIIGEHIKNKIKPDGYKHEGLRSFFISKEDKQQIANNTHNDFIKKIDRCVAFYEPNFNIEVMHGDVNSCGTPTEQSLYLFIIYGILIDDDNANNTARKIINITNNLGDCINYGLAYKPSKYTIKYSDTGYGSIQDEYNSIVAPYCPKGKSPYSNVAEKDEIDILEKYKNSDNFIKILNKFNQIIKGEA